MVMSFRNFVSVAFLSCIAGCASDHMLRDGASVAIVISVADQRLAVMEGGKQAAVYKISTARAGVGEALDSDKTPRGKHQIVEKIGDGVPLGMVIADRIPTGEIVKEHIPGRWPVTTRILRLGGLEDRNRNTFERLIYIHGSPVEHLLGKPASGGCIRMRASDVVDLFNKVNVGTSVYITEVKIDAPVRLAGFANY